MEAEIAAVRQQAAIQVAAAKKEAAAARAAAEAEAARNDAATAASAAERQATLSANLADLRAEYEVHMCSHAASPSQFTFFRVHLIHMLCHSNSGPSPSAKQSIYSVDLRHARLYHQPDLHCHRRISVEVLKSFSTTIVFASCYRAIGISSTTSACRPHHPLGSQERRVFGGRLRDWKTAPETWKRRKQSWSHRRRTIHDPLSGLQSSLRGLLM